MSTSATGGNGPNPGPTPTPTKTATKPPPPAPPAQMVIDANALQALLGAINPQHVPQPPAAPRVGGVNSVGAWTGAGSADDALHPRTGHCLRKFVRDDSKTYTALSALEDRCRGGIKSLSSAGPFFCLDSETDAKHVITVIQSLKDYLETHGLDPVFNIVTATGTINMLDQPSLLTKAVVDTWVQDLKTNGVHDGRGGRLALCPYDRMNLDWSYDTVLNSCSANLVLQLKNNLTASEHNGPNALFEVLQHVYRRSEAKVEAIVKKIEALNIRDFPGQNVTQYKAQCDMLLDELAMNLPVGQNVPTLRTKALHGLTQSTYPFFHGKVIEKTMESNPLAMNTSTVLGVKMALREMNDLYLELMEHQSYPPGNQPAKEEVHLKAMQAEVKSLKDELTKLTQDRSATSTVGNKSKSRWPRSQSTDSNGSNDSDSKPSGILKDSKYSSSDKKVQFDKKLPNPQGTNGLSAEESEKLTALIKEKLTTMPNFDEIPDDKVYTIDLDGKKVATFCRKCRRFTRGTKQHSTQEHKGKGYSRGKSMVARASTYLGSSTPPPVPTPPTGSSVCVPIQAPTSYSFEPVSAPLTRAGAFYSASATFPIVENDDDDSVGSVDPRLLATLGYPKGLGRQD
jgi:hypothetical protein